jgi:hypothetical protein
MGEDAEGLKVVPDWMLPPNKYRRGAIRRRFDDYASCDWDD